MDVEELARLNVIYTANWLVDSTKALFKSSGLSMPLYNVLRIVKGKDPEVISPGEIKEVMLDKSPDVTRLLDKLVSQGFIFREVCPENRRKVNVSITKEGKQKTDDLKKALDLITAKQKRLTKQEATNLNNLLDKIRD